MQAGTGGRERERGSRAKGLLSLLTGCTRVDVSTSVVGGKYGWPEGARGWKIMVRAPCTDPSFV